MQNKWLYFTGIALILWVAPFVISFPLLPLMQADRALFHNVMILISAAVAAPLLHHAFTKGLVKYGGPPLAYGFQLGLVCLVLNLGIDIPLFTGPLNMPLAEYISWIGSGYSLMVLMPVLVGWILASRKN